MNYLRVVTFLQSHHSVVYQNNWSYSRLPLWRLSSWPYLTCSASGNVHECILDYCLLERFTVSYLLPNFDRILNGRINNVIWNQILPAVTKEEIHAPYKCCYALLFPLLLCWIHAFEQGIKYRVPTVPLQKRCRLWSFGYSYDVSFPSWLWPNVNRVLM